MIKNANKHSNNGRILMNKLIFSLAFLGLAFPFNTSLAASVEHNLHVEGQTNQAGQQSQRVVDKLSRETQNMLREYQNLMQQGDYQNAYNKELTQRLDEQAEEIASLKKQLADVQITRLHIMPFLRDKTAELKQFIELDLPFEQEDRLASIKRLEDRLSSSKVSLSDKFRRLMQAWQSENDYSYQLQSFRDTVQWQGEDISVNFLRVGRVALYFQSLDGKLSAYWHSSKKQWLEVEPRYHAAIQQALRVADKQLPPQLLALPINNKEAK